MTDLADLAGLVRREHGLSVVSTLRPDGTIQSSVVNAGVLDHPVTGAPVVGFTTRRGTAKLAHLRVRPRASLVVRVGWEWAAATPWSCVGRRASASTGSSTSGGS